MTRCMIRALNKHYQGNHINEREMGGACGTYGGEQNYMQATFNWEISKEKGSLIDIIVDGMILLKPILNAMEGCGLDCCSVGCGQVAGFE